MIEDGLVLEPDSALVQEDIFAIQYSKDQDTWRDIDHNQYNIECGQLVLQYLFEMSSSSIRIITRKEDKYNLFSINDVNFAGSVK